MLRRRLSKLFIASAQRTICAIVAIALVLQPIHRMMALASVAGILSSPWAVFAQTPPQGAAEGRELGESLLHGPTTDGETIFFRGADGAERIDASELFQSSGSADDLATMLEVFGDDEAALERAAEVQQRLTDEDSQQGRAYRTVRESAQAHSHPDMASDPAFRRSEALLAGEDPIFDSFFEGCEEVEVPVGGGSSVHVPELHYCSRVITPVESCEISHTYEASLVRLVGGEGGIQSCGDGCIDLYVGRVADNYWSGQCTVFEQEVRVQVDNAAAITSAVLSETRWDDYMQILIDGERVWQGPNTNFPPETAGPCELRTNWAQSPNVDLTTHFQNNGPLEFLIRVSVTGNGEGYARIRIHYDESRLVTLDDWTISPECNALIEGLNDGACALQSMQCLDGPAMDVQCLTVNGFEICQDNLSAGPIAGYSPLCRRGQITGSCSFNSGPLECWTDPSGVRHCPQNDGGNPNGCAVFENDSSCGFVESSCLPFALGESGRCYAFQETWDCGYDVTTPGGTSTRVTCDGPIRCMGEDCVSPRRETNPDFARAASTLTAMTFMAMETQCLEADPAQCRIFAGEAMECKRALGGYQDCCEQPVSVGLADYLKLTMASYDLAQKMHLGQTLANAGLNVPGAWNAIRNFASSSWSTITQPFTSAWGSLVQSYGGAAVEAIETFSLEALKQEMMNATAQFVTETFGTEVASMFFTQTGTDAAGEAVYGLSETFATALNVVMWIYTIYLLVNILIDIIWACEEEEFLLAARREMNACTRLGSYCASDSPFGCIEQRDAYCCYNSPLARIVMDAARPQFNIETGTPEAPDCAGLTIAQVAALDWSQVDLGQWYGILAANGIIPNGAESFDTNYALENATRNQTAVQPAPNAPERIQAEVEAAQYFDEARQQVREDLWDSVD